MLSSYSYSSLETFNNCPRKFKFAYIEKAPKDKRISAVMQVGRIVHQALDILHKHGNDGVLYPKNDIVEYYLKEWKNLSVEKLKLDSDFYTMEDYIRLGQEMLERYYDKYQPFKEGVLIGSELHLRFTLPGTNFEFNAIIDKVVKHDDGSVEIVDYKTGQNIVSPEDFRFNLQMGIYQAALLSKFPDYKDITMTQHFISKDEKISKKFREGEIDEFIEVCKKFVLITLEAERLDNFPTKESPACNYCDYYEICPAKKHRQLLDENEEEVLDPDSLAVKAKSMADEYIELDNQVKELKYKQEQLKAEMIELAREYEMTNLEGETGKVKIAVTVDEKFVTKSDDEKAFNKLTQICRDLNLLDYFKLDPTALMKEVIRMKRLPDEQLNILKDYIVQKESSRVTVRRKKEKLEE